MSKKIVIDKEVWYSFLDSLYERKVYVPNITTTEIDTNQSISERAKEYLEQKGIKNYILNKTELCEHWTTPTDLIIYGATEQDLISKGEFAEWCSINGWYFYIKDNMWRKHGNGGFKYKTTEELFKKFTNR